MENYLLIQLKDLSEKEKGQWNKVVVIPSLTHNKSFAGSKGGHGVFSF